MKLYISMVKRKPSLFSYQEEMASFELPKGEVLSRKEYDNIKDSCDDIFFGNVYVYEQELEELTFEAFSEMKENMSIKDLSVIYNNYPFLFNIKNEENASNSGNGGNFVTGMLIGKMLD